jgi:hypothetical protein
VVVLPGRGHNALLFDDAVAAHVIDTLMRDRERGTRLRPCDLAFHSL